jgi:glycosyl transferase family 2
VGNTRSIWPWGRRHQTLALIVERLERLDNQVTTLTESVANHLAHLAVEQTRLTAILSADRHQLKRVLRTLAAEDGANRRRLVEARAAPDYELAFTEEHPLVSIVIPSHDRAELLRTRSLASALAQTYEHVEVIVVGDQSPPAVRTAVESFGDPRVRFHPLPTPYRGGWDERSQWRIRSVMARTHGLRLARGRWLLAFDDDDEMRPNQVELLLALARERCCEVAYGVAERRWQDGSTDDVGTFPPVLGGFGWQCAIYHAGLGFFERQLVATDFDEPADWFMCWAMLRAGVSFAMLEETVCTIYPSETGHRERERVIREPASDDLVLEPEAVHNRATPLELVTTPWHAPSRFGPAGWAARQAMRRLMRPLEVRQREADESLANAIEALSDRVRELEARVAANSPDLR